MAVWQKLNDKAWFTKNDIPKSSASLSPFYLKTDSGEIELYNSDDVRECTKLGYEYDVLKRNEGEDENAYINRINEYVDSYPHTGKALLQASNKQPQVLGSSFTDDGTFPDYVINVFYDRSVQTSSGAPRS